MILAKYIRLSSADEVVRFGERAESSSVTHQRMLLDRYIAEHCEFDGCAVLEFSDDGRSGTNFDRPGIQALLDAARCRRIDCVLVKDFSRFGRNYLEACDYIERVFPMLGIRFISVNDGYDSGDHPYGTAGDLGSGLRSLINEMYSRDLSQKSKAAKRQYAQRGQCIHGYPIYGYVKPPENRRTWIPDSEAAPVVREVFRRFLNGLRAAEIARELNRQGIPSPSQRKRALGYSGKVWKGADGWNGGAVGRILREERYTGKLIALKTTAAELGSGGPKKKIPQEDWIVIPDAFEAIIPQQAFEQAQKRIQSQKRTRKRAECKSLGRRESGLEQSGVQAGPDRRAEREPKRPDAAWTRRQMQVKLERLTTRKKEAYLRYDRGELSLDAFAAECGALTWKIKELRQALADAGACSGDNMSLPLEETR